MENVLENLNIDNNLHEKSIEILTDLISFGISFKVRSIFS